MNAMYCQEGVSDYLGNFDYITFNCGHHAAKLPSYTISEYLGVLDRFALSLTGIDTTKQKIFYLENVAVPLFRSKTGEIDKRTYHRLYLFDFISKRALYRHNVAYHVIPAFDSTLSLNDKFCDCGHYPFGANIPQLLDLLHACKAQSRYLE